MSTRDLLPLKLLAQWSKLDPGLRAAPIPPEEARGGQEGARVPPEGG